MDRTVVKNATCTGCGCLCDDIELHTERQRIVSAEQACDRGRDLFLDHGRDDAFPSALIDGQPAPMDEAIEVAVEILMSADMPLVYGLSNSTSESQQAAIMLAEEIGAVVDSPRSLVRTVRSTADPDPVAVEIDHAKAAQSAVVRPRPVVVI